MRLQERGDIGMQIDVVINREVSRQMEGNALGLSWPVCRRLNNDRNRLNIKKAKGS